MRTDWYIFLVSLCSLFHTNIYTVIGPCDARYTDKWNVEMKSQIVNKAEALANSLMETKRNLGEVELKNDDPDCSISRTIEYPCKIVNMYVEVVSWSFCSFSPSMELVISKGFFWWLCLMRDESHAH